MPFKKKTWKNRVSEYPNRRQLKKEDGGSTERVTVTRDEGIVSQEGDAFNDKNMNDLEDRIAETTRILKDTLRVSGWSSDGPPYTQTLQIEGILETDQPIIAKGEPATKDTASYKALAKNAAFIDSAETADGSITFTCWNKKPTVDIPIIIKGL